MEKGSEKNDYKIFEVIPVMKRKQPKIAIMTIVNSNKVPNWGSKLQNYALQTILERMGCKVCTINDARLGYNTYSFKDHWKDLAHYITRYHYRAWEHGKRVRCLLWIHRHLHYTKEVMHKDEDFGSLVPQYDFFLAGSDQIWNPTFTWYSNKEAFLQFAKPEQKLCYAPSIGVSEIDFPEERASEYKEWLKDFQYLSCREIEGSKIIHKLTGKTVQTLLDPTLLLTTRDWDKLSCNIFPRRRYILFYPLAEITEEYRQYVERLSGRLDMPIVQIKWEDWHSALSPSEFIRYIKGAAYVVTDSFHGTVFSMLYHKPITYVQSCDVMQQTSTRLHSLLNLAAIKVDFTQRIIPFPSINWAIFEDNLNQQRKVSFTYLKQIIHNYNE